MTKFPDIVSKRIAVKLRNAAERKLRQGHPWVFNDSIVKESHVPVSGDLAIIYDHKTNKLMGIGLFDCESPIRIKMIHHKGGAKIDQNWFSEKILKAYEIRQPLVNEHTNSFRLLFGEADGMPGCICDVYDGNAVLKIYSACWMPYLEWICTAISSQVSEVKSVILRLSRSLQQVKESYGVDEGDVLIGELEDEVVTFTEHGVHFSAHLIKGHKTGFFLDHRANRRRVGELSKGKTVLDVFSYAGGFSIHALCGGARHVTSTDISGPALELAKANASLNEFDGVHEVLQGDAFKVLEKKVVDGKLYDVVVIDPPSFAKQKSEQDIALDQYARLARLGCRLVNPNGVLMMASCSSRVLADDFFEVVEEAMVESGVRFQLMSRHLHDIDHPIISTFPEGNYLKCGFYRII